MNEEVMQAVRAFGIEQFNPEEKEKAREIVKQLEGLTITQAQFFLSKVSEALLYIKLR